MIVFLLLGLLVTTWSSSVTSQKIASSTGQEEGTGAAAAAAPTAGSTSVDVGGGVFLTPASIIEKEARGPNRFAYSVNLLVGLNSTLSITTLNSSKPVYWALAQRLANSSVTRTTQLYMLGQPNIRDDSPVLRATYQCAPKETDCTTMTVNSVKLNSLGDYSYQTFVNTLDSLYVDYNVSAWVQPLDFQCGGSIGAGIEANLTGQPQQPSQCAVNRTLGLFSVLGSNRVTVTCSILVAQNEVYEPQADVVIRSVEDNTECSDTENTQVRIIPPFMAATILGPLQQQQQQSSVNSVLYRLSRNCTRIFTKAALNSRLTCSLQPRAQAGLQTPAQLRPTTVYTSVSMTMDVQYAPEYSAPPSLQFNRTMIVNSSSPTPVFTCPFESNPPPQFEWRVSTVVVNSSASSASSPARRRIDPTDFHTSGKDYIIQRDLEVGLYGFECRARTLGLVNKYSDTVKFYLNVIPVPVSSKKAIVSGDRQNSYLKTSQANVGAIVGGVIGGVLAILVIVLLVLFLIRRHRNGLKDESEKAKELDIGINDNNPHLSSRSNLSTAGLTSGPATTTSSSASSSTNGTTTTASVASHMNGGVGGGAKSNGIGHKAIAGLMVPSSTAQSYAAIAHAAAAAAAQQNRNIFNGSANGGVGTNNINGAVSGGDQPNGVLKHTSQSYNNPGFFESTTSYTIPQNHLESPPPYDSALHNQQQQQQQSQQPAKKDSSMMLQNQQKDYMGSNSRLLGGSGSNTPTLVHKNPNGGGNGGIVSGPGMPQSHSYSNQLGLGPATPSNNGANSLQQMQYPGSGNLQYTTVQNLARNRQPLSGTGGATVAADMDPQSATQYTTMTQLNPIDV